MKKFPSILFVFSLLFMLTACSSSADPSQESSGQTTSPSSQQDSVSVSNAVLESESTESEQSANNTLIVYFSRWGNTEYPSDVDATTSASIVVDNNFRYGTTEYVANMIAENVGGDLHRIETVTPYTADFDELQDVNHDEMSSNYLPELKESNLDISAYDTVFIGYPVWATDVPQAVLSFLKEYDLSGKTVIPFCTHDGYGAGNSYQTIAEASHTESEGTKVLVAYFSATNTTEGVAEHIANGLNADIYEIVPEDPYTDADLNYNDNNSRTTIEMNDPNARPAISGSVENMEQYDIIFVGYPIWWGEAPRIVSTFMESYDFSGKTIVPFCTSGGSGISSSASNLERLTSGTTWLDGRRLNGSDSQDTVMEWVNSLDLNLAE